MSLEKKIQHRVINYAKKKGFICLKINIGSQRGWPDYLLIDPDGWHIWMEFKQPGKAPSQIQSYRMEQLTLREVLVVVVDNEEQGYATINELVAARVSEESDEDAPIPGECRIISRSGPRKN